MPPFSAAAALLLVAPASAYLLSSPVFRRAAPADPAVHAFSRTPIQPQMNLGDRFVRLVKSNVAAAISGLEDPEKVLSQAVDDMQRDLVKVRQAYAEVSASTKRMEEQRKLAENEAAKWYQRAQLALEKGEDDLAREALTRRQQQTEMVDSLTEQIEAQSGSITTLYESMKELEAKMAEAKAKKDQIIARARTAKAATKVNDMLAGVGSSSSMAAFERMKDKVEQLEAEADVSRQLAQSSPKALSGSGGSTLESKFKALEGSSSVDDQLKSMKAALPSAKVDDELEEMRRAMGKDAKE